MGRPRSFDTSAAVAAAAEVFRKRGYESTSVDDLVVATGLQRGSLYGTFGSKLGIFSAALHHVVGTELPAALTAPCWRQDLVTGTQLDLLLIAALELAPRDATVRDLVTAAITTLASAAPADDPTGLAAALLGSRLLHRAGSLTPTIHPERGSIH